MLVLTRYPTQDVILREKGTSKVVAVVRVISSRGQATRLGFDCPSDIEVFRKEIDDVRQLQIADRFVERIKEQK